MPAPLYPGKSRKEMEKAMRILVETGITPQRLEMKEPTLESLFMEVTGT